MLSLLSAYFKIISLGLKGDVVAGAFVAGWLTALVSVEVTGFQFGTMTAHFYSLLPGRDWSGLKQMAAKFAYFIVFMAMAKAVALGVRGLLARAMRRNLTHHLHRSYCTSLSINSALSQVDQRICEDVERVCLGSLKIFEVFLMAPMLVFWYTVRVAGLMSPWGLGAIYAHFFLFWGLLRPALYLLRQQIKRKEERDAILRLEHVNIAQNGSEFGALPGESLNALRVNLNFSLYRTLFTTKQLILTDASIEAIKSVSAYSGSLLCFALMAGEAAFGKWRDVVDAGRLAEKISLTAYVALYLIFQLGRLTGVVDDLGIVNGQVERLNEVIAELSGKESSTESAESVLDIPSDEFLKSAVIAPFSGKVDCALLSPSGHLLVENVCFPLESSKNVLICGPNGTGKSTLLTGIYSNQLPVQWTKPPKSCLFCPQAAVLFTGSALDLLGESMIPDDGVEEAVPVDEENPIPLLTASAGIGRVHEALKAVGLENSQFDLEKVYTIAQWKTHLTPGQLNRLALARVLLKKPQFALLDETLVTLFS